LLGAIMLAKISSRCWVGSGTRTITVLSLGTRRRGFFHFSMGLPSHDEEMAG